MDADSSGALGFPIDTAVCFSDHKGRHRKGIEKHQTKLLGKAAPLLRTLLRPGEKVLLTVPACSPASVIEQVTTGWVIYYVKRCQLVVTDRRILELAVKRDMTPRLSAVEIEHAGIAEAKVSTFLSRSLRLRYRNGLTDQFTQLDSRATAQLKALLPRLTGQAVEPAPGARRHLCPRCANRLESRERCPHCFLEFRTREMATRYAILYPGGGYFYTGHPVLGVFDALAELFLLVLLATGLVGLAASGGAAEDLVALAFVGFLLLVEKAVSVYHARHYVADYLPVDTEITPVKAA